MNPALWLHHLEHTHFSRRDALGLVAKVGAAGALGMLGHTKALARDDDRSRNRPNPSSDQFNDEAFDYSDPANLSDWVPSRYGPEDQRGTFNEVTPERTAETLGRVLDRRRPVKTYNCGELMWNGFPAFVTTPARGYQQRLTLTGYPPPPDFLEGGGFFTRLEPFGTTRTTVHEERFPSVPGAPAGLTYQIGTQLDNLNHVGGGEFLYNGFRAPEILRSWGTIKLGSEHMGPIVTRGVLLDILGLKLAKGDREALGAPALNGKPVLNDTYRITLEDIFEAMEYGHIRSFKPGDVILFRTGWNQLLQQRDPDELLRWGARVGHPGPYLREVRFLAQFRPAVMGGDTWSFEVLGRPDLAGTTAFAVHQELLMRYGIRIGESIVLDGLAEDRVYEFVYIVTPQYAEGATAGNTPPVALGQPRG
jgi:kynurenine formamidase